jgi:hypothetical protein
VAEPLPAKLLKTGSLPLIGLLGMLSSGASFGIRITVWIVLRRSSRVRERTLGDPSPHCQTCQLSPCRLTGFVPSGILHEGWSLVSFKMEATSLLGIVGLSADRRFATAYNAGLQAAKVWPSHVRAIGSLRSDITVSRWKARNLFWVNLQTNMLPILRLAAENEILSTTPCPTLHRDGSKGDPYQGHSSFTAKSKTGSRKNTLH